MIHPHLRLAAAKFALGLARTSTLVDAARTALEDAIYAGGLAILAAAPKMADWEAHRHFAAAIRELDHAFASQDDALRYLRLDCFGPMAEEMLGLESRLRQHFDSFDFYRQHSSLDKLDAWNAPTVKPLREHWYKLPNIRQIQLEMSEYFEAREAWWIEAGRLCRDWCREYARLYLQPAWRSPTVVSLASGIHAERAFDRLPILADALDEAGCDHPDLLAHCRTPGPHTDYCWLVDALLTQASGG